MIKKKIHKLNKETINLIAAGEVIENPASIIKELVENSIDANASSIIIEVMEGGKSYIRVTDDGYGISEEDLPIAFDRHTTSKLSSILDFDHLKTNGFRGEALGSISAVSKINVTSKTSGQLYGIKLIMNGGIVTEKSKTGARDGTTIIIQDLFYNTPARKKFLKSNGAESAKISEILIKLAIINAHIKFKYINNNKVMLSTPGNKHLLDTLNSIFNNEFQNGFIFIDSKKENITLRGLIGHNSIMYSSRKFQFLYVNGRVIKSKEINESIEKAFRHIIPQGNYPAFVIDIIMDSSLVDVNVHPAKQEVKFSVSNMNEIVYDLVKTTLDEFVMIPKVSFKDKMNTIKEQNKIEFTNLDIKSLISSNSEENSTKNFIIPLNKVEYESDLVQVVLENQTIPYDAPIPQQNENQKYTVDFDFHHPNVIGVLLKTYILCENNNSLYLIDQHAAHERILYEKLMNSFHKKTINTQHLLEPLIFNIPIYLYEDIPDMINFLNEYHFDASEFGENTMILRGIPDFFTVKQARQFANELLNIKSGEKINGTLINDKIAMEACKAAVKGNDFLENEEISFIINELSLCNNKYACPHGRPIIVQITQYEIEKMFKRIVG